MNFTPLEFNYNTRAVTQNNFSEHIKLYQKYISTANNISKQLKNNINLKDANPTYSDYRELKKEETFALDAIILHELYFQNMTSKKEDISEKCSHILNLHFDSVSKFIDELTACALSARGWCILVYEQRSNEFKLILLDAHDYGVICMSYPILVLDVYEHAYFMDYGTDRAKYISKFIESINWSIVEHRIDKIIKI